MHEIKIAARAYMAGSNCSHGGNQHLYHVYRVAASAHGVPLHVAIVEPASCDMRITQSLECAFC